MINTRNMFVFTFVCIIATYLFMFGQEKTVQMLTKEYLLYLALIPLVSAFVFFKVKLKGFEIIDFLPNNQFSLKSSVVFFLVFQVVDYYYEDGFIGMISQWFLYWIYGIIALLLMQVINYYKNYKMIRL
ncbi:hypothetical protein [Sulfurospirillum arcachonense]|uniref:hypothetical protein n=1 Tax=Sulfurospirillum arcachonense TaxID=57666 RepID=UPI0012EB5055|nr:hypothetical protein [Sulfurospirillum arcachonense]